MSLFALLNKVAGAYGMLAVVLSGGAALSQPLGQITMYIYSIVSLVGFIWGLQKISEVGSGFTHVRRLCLSLWLTILPPLLHRRTATRPSATPICLRSTTSSVPSTRPFSPSSGTSTFRMTASGSPTRRRKRP